MLELFHDVTSASSYVSVVRMQALADDGVPVRFHGVDMRGLAVTMPVSLDILAELEHAHREATELGLVLIRPRLAPPTTAVHVVADLAESLDLGAAWRIATYRAYWEEGKDLARAEVLAEIGVRCGLDPVEVQRLATDQSVLAAKRRLDGTLRADGIGGVPIVRASGTLVPATLPDEDLRHLANL